MIDTVEVLCSALDGYPIEVSEAHKLALATDPSTAVTYWHPVHIRGETECL